MKKIKNVLCIVASVFCLMLPTVVQADMQGAITDSENNIMKELQEGVTISGKTFHFDASDITQAENYLKAHKVSDETATEVADYVKEARQLIVDNAQNIDVQSVYSLKDLIKSLPRPVIDQLKDIVLKIGQLLNLVITFYRDGVSVVDPSGATVYATGDAIKQTGGDYTMSFVAIGGLLALSILAYFAAGRRECRV